MEKLVFVGVGVILFGIVAVLIFVIGDNVLSTEQQRSVTVVERMYEAAKTSTGVGITASGQTGVVVTSSSAKYDLLLEFENGQREIVRTDEDTFVNVYDDEIITLTCHYGGWTEDLISCQL